MQANFVHKFFMPEGIVRAVIFTFLILAVVFYAFVASGIINMSMAKLQSRL